jgi:hypothetical protein
VPAVIRLCYDRWRVPGLPLDDHGSVTLRSTASPKDSHMTKLKARNILAITAAVLAVIGVIIWVANR